MLSHCGCVFWQCRNVRTRRTVASFDCVTYCLFQCSVFSSTHCFCGYAPRTCGLCSFLLFTRPCPHRLWSYRFIFLLLLWWFGSRVVSMLDSGTEGPGFKSQSRRCWVTVLGKLFTPIVPLHQAAKLVAALLSIVRVTAGLVESNVSLPPGL